MREEERDHARAHHYSNFIIEMFTTKVILIYYNSLTYYNITNKNSQLDI